VRILVTLLGLLLAVVLLGLAVRSGDGLLPEAVAAEEPGPEVKAQALKAFERGTSFYQKADFDRAIEQWEGGYRLVAKPVFLYNIAQAHRLSKRPDKALQAYRRYLRESPEAKNRPEVEERIAGLESELAVHLQLPELFVPSLPPGQEAVEPKPQPLIGEASADAQVEQQRQRRRKLLPIVLGAVGGAVALGVVLGIGIYFGTRQPAAAVFNPVAP
jgi:tetratricopeptide (TPR) repeat protein